MEHLAGVEPFPLLDGAMSESDDDEISSASRSGKLAELKAKSSVPFADRPAFVRTETTAAIVCPESKSWSQFQSNANMNAQVASAPGSTDNSTEEDEDPVTAAQPECMTRHTLEVLHRLREMRQRIPFHVRGVPAPAPAPSGRVSKAEAAYYSKCAC